jgi:MraZ protein
MFIGIYKRSIGNKGRVAVPKEFRKQLQEKAVITRGLDGCLFLFPKKKWQEIADKLNKTPMTSSDARSFVRLLTYEAFEVEFDGQGRILIPEPLREFGGLGDKAIIAGSLERIEIWDEDSFDKYQKQIEKDSNKIAERITDLEIEI